MSDQAEAPPKKIGSLRDRIAAFEKAGTGSAGPAPAPPAPRPKPAGFSSWKPRPPSPTSGEASQPATSPKPSAGLSTADAKESITKGQSLKERMAALQGKGAFGGPPPVAPKPALEKPKWKPPPVVSAPKDDDDDEDQPRKQLDLEGIVRAPPALGGEPNTEGDAEGGESKESHPAEGEEAAEPDPEEEERQRRAAIAARLARLGGARVGMAPPPVFGKRPPPPPKKRASVSEDVAVSEQRETVSSPKLQATEPEAVSNNTIAHSPPTSEHAAESSPPPQDTPVRKSSEAGSLVSVESSESHQSSRSPPAAMPVPAAPRRAAPPRKKPAKPTAPPPPVPEVESEQQEETSAPAAEAPVGPTPEAAPSSDALLTPLPPTPAPSEQVPSASVDEKPAVPEEPKTSAEDVPAEVVAPVVARAQSPAEVTETKREDQEGSGVKPEEEIDEETKRRQVAERIARMGGVNPFSAQGPPRKSSDAKVSSPPPAEEESDHPVSPPPVSQSRRSSKLSEAPMSPPLPATQEKRLSQGSVDLSRGHLVPQEPTFEEPPPAEDLEEDESTKRRDIIEQDEPPVSQSLPTVTKSDSVQQQGARPNEDLAEADGDSEYSNDDDDLRGNTDIPPAVPPTPHPHHSPAVPHRGVPPPPLLPVEDDDRTSEEEYNEDMVRSQILPPVGGVSDKNVPPVPRRDSSAQQEEVGLAYEGSGSEYEDDEEVPQAPARIDGPSSVPPAPPGRPNIPARSPPPPANRALPPAPPAIVHSTSQDSLKVPAPVEVLDDDEGDPIDPSFHSPSRRTSQVLPSSTSVIPAEDEHNSTTVEQQPVDVTPEPQEVSEAARRKTLADRMAKLGGIQFGAVPTPGFPRRPPPPPQQADEGEADAGSAEGSREQPEVDEEEEERARKERIAAKLAGMGGMRIGMMPSAFPPRKSHVITGESATPAPPPRAPLAPPPPPPQAHESESEVEGSTASDDVVKVEADESDLEEVRHEDAEEEPAPPPVPSRSARPMRRESVEVPSSPPLASSPQRRPPVPAGLPPRRPSTRSVGSERRVSGESAISPPPSQRRPSAPKPHTSEYVMVEEPQGYEEEALPLPPNRPAGRRTSGPPTRSPPPPLAEDSISSQWELPAIPTSNLDIGGSDLEMSWTEAEAPREVAPAPPSLGHRPVAQSPPPLPPVQSVPVGSSESAAEQHLSADDLMALWGRVGVQVCEAAMTLFERSKKGLIGDGTYPGFIHAVIQEVPNALLANDWGYLIYKQNGPSVQKRASDIMPGDLVELHDAKLKGHKGLQVYHQNVGAEEAVVGVIGEFDAKKSKIKVFQANQHVGQQTVESVSYRLEDLKSGVVKVYRVLEAR